MMLALGLALQIAGASYSTMPGIVASAPDAALDSLMGAEGRFLAKWRAEWTLSKRPRPTYLRLASVHCHRDGSWQSGMPNIIRSATSKRSFCPIWYPVDDSLTTDEAISGIDVSLTEESRRIVRRERANLIRRLDSAYAVDPANGWLAGQVVRFNVDQRELQEAIDAARRCRAGSAWCRLLEGYALHAAGMTARADSTFVGAVEAMTPDDRCEWTSIAPLLDDRARAAYSRVPCSARDSLDNRYWWLADPLYIEAGNARRAEHFSRQVLVRLHSALNADERWDWRPKYGGDALAKMIIRYGWPSHSYWAGLREDAGHFEWLGFRDNSVNVAPEYTLPRFHVTPPWRAVVDPSTLAQGDWTRLAPKQGYGALEWENDNWPTEHAVRDGGPVVDLPEQSVAFRRDNDALLAVGLNLPQRFFRPGHRMRYDAAIVESRGPRDRWAPARDSLYVDGTGTTVLTSPLSSRARLFSAELAPAEGGRGLAARARRAIRPPASLSSMSPGELAVSDPLFFKPDSTADLPTSAPRAIRMMLGSLTIAEPKVGLFWETYGAEPNDTLDVSIRVASIDRPSAFKRLAARIGLADARGAEVVTAWREEQASDPRRTMRLAGVPVQSRAITLDISNLPSGRYVVELTMTRPNGVQGSTRREIVVQR